MRRSYANLSYMLMALVGAAGFYGALGVKINAEPHPGLRDGALKKALRKDHNHQELSYVRARHLIFNEIDGDGRKAECIYTGTELKYFKQPLPNNGATEHAWPLTRLPSQARSDMHHMYPVEAEARVARLNLHYGKVMVPVWSSGGSRSGPSKKVLPVFEVRKSKRGDIARAMFYVATMYDLDIPSAEEAELRAWHREDPVDARERKRNNAVAKEQRSRNPFVDHPNIVRRIANF